MKNRVVSFSVSLCFTKKGTVQRKGNNYNFIVVFRLRPLISEKVIYYY